MLQDFLLITCKARHCRRRPQFTTPGNCGSNSWEHSGSESPGRKRNLTAGVPYIVFHSVFTERVITSINSSFVDTDLLLSTFSAIHHVVHSVSLSLVLVGYAAFRIHLILAKFKITDRSVRRATRREKSNIHCEIRRRLAS